MQKENKYIMLFWSAYSVSGYALFNKIKETNIIQIQRVRNCDKSIRYALMVLEFNFFYGFTCFEIFGYKI